MPPSLDAFPDPALNRDLYFWLAALAASMDGLPAIDNDPLGVQRNQAATCLALARWPGLAARYERLVAAYLPLRLAPEGLPAAEALRENALRTALTAPGTVKACWVCC